MNTKSKIAIAMIFSSMVIPNYAMAGGCCSVPKVDSPRINNPEETESANVQDFLPMVDMINESPVSEASPDVQSEPDLERIDNINAFMEAEDELNRGLSPESLLTRISTAVNVYSEDLTDLNQRREELGLPPDPEIETSLQELAMSDEELPAALSPASSPNYPAPR
ncbi:MAG: hypothetical protein C4617_02765 [Candidatus Liberibacter europaeus]|uniref:DUF3035 domain-containing protein n=1 Tax=Candidatus Liberibacter europaeus TaxID=744859 RepID=A0A2T4VYA3_9HYPH|nr:hypothetical protein [Candidatus Liberibacter europaeus]PTL86746.1 MAG: hypothetical protein C4617_02765 [Candidatus Liberibacter europaeus]